MEYIGDDAFSYCESLQEISFPKTLKSISAFAFKHCSSLSSIMLHATTEVNEYAFVGCDKLKHVNIIGNHDANAYRPFRAL